MSAEAELNRSVIRRLNIQGVDEDRLLKLMNESDDNEASGFSPGLHSDSYSNSDLSDSGINLDAPPKELGLIQQLRAELIQRDQQMGYLQKQHEVRLSEERGRYDELEHRRSLDRVGHEQQLGTLQGEFERLQTRLVSEVEALRLKHRQIEADVPQLQQQLATSKDDFRTLTVSETLYRSLLKTPEEDLSLRDFIRIKLYKELTELKQLSTAQQAELEEVRGRERILSQDRDRLQRQFDAMSRENNMQDAAVYGDVNVLTARCEALQKSLTESRLEANANKGKVEEFDKLHRDYANVQDDLESACKELVVCKAALSGLEHEHRARQADHVERQTTVELLKQNEGYLTRQLEQAESRNAELEETLARKKSKLAALKHEQMEWIEKSSKQETGWQRTTEDQLQQELNRLRDRADRDREEIRAALKETYDREAHALRDVKESACRELQNERQRSVESKKAYEQLMATHRDMEAKLSNQCIESRGQLKIKLFELDRVTLAYEEAMTQSRTARLEVEALKKKVEMLKQEYYKVDNDATKRNSMLEARCAEQARRITHYEQLEKELDHAILDVGAGDGSKQDGFAELGAALPTDGARRIRQSIGLARQVAVIQREKDQLARELAQAKKELVEARMQSKDMKKAQERAVQPQGYLVEVIEEKEKRAIAAEHANSRLSKELGEARAALEAAQGDVASLLEVRRDVASVLEGHSGLANVKEALQSGSRARFLTNTQPSKPSRDENTPMWYKKLKG